MPLFGSKKDARLINSITRELFHKYISNEIEVFKLALPETEINLYNESDRKVYYQPIRLFCNINKEAQTMNDVDTGMDVSQVLTFSFLRDDLIEKNIVLSEGDILKFDSKYWEVDNSFSNQYFMGRNDETHLITTENRDRGFGKNISVTVSAHLTRISQLNLTEYRTGNDVTVRNTNQRLKNL
jgi:hypothetical protein